MTSSADKIAGAPISWGVCEAPGWDYQLRHLTAVGGFTSGIERLLITSHSVPPPGTVVKALRGWDNAKPAASAHENP
jgi:hypothetical protein